MPKIGLRNIKTAISVFICVAIYLAIALFANIFYKSFDKSILLATEMYTPFFACIATAYSVHTDKGKSVAQAKLRLVASIIGGLTGVLIITIYTKIVSLIGHLVIFRPQVNQLMDLLPLILQLSICSHL